MTARQTPEGRELESKRDELAAQQTELVQRELELATLSGRLHSFEQRYLSSVGVRYAQLDHMEADMAEAQARLDPTDNTAHQRAAEARNRATESERVSGEKLLEPAPQDRFDPKESMKKAYREIAKLVHPDLTTDADERVLRNQVMAEVNRAYERGDEVRLRALLEEWESRPEAVPGESVGAELVRTIRRIAQVSTRLSKITAEIASLMASELHQLMLTADSAAAKGRDLLEEMASKLDRQIAEARGRFDSRAAQVGKR